MATKAPATIDDVLRWASAGERYELSRSIYLTRVKVNLTEICFYIQRHLGRDGCMLVPKLENQGRPLEHRSRDQNGCLY
jgi:hypothetical protein